MIWLFFLLVKRIKCCSRISYGFSLRPSTTDEIRKEIFHFHGLNVEMHVDILAEVAHLKHGIVIKTVPA